MRLSVLRFSHSPGPGNSVSSISAASSFPTHYYKSKRATRKNLKLLSGFVSVESPRACCEVASSCRKPETALSVVTRVFSSAANSVALSSAKSSRRSKLSFSRVRAMVGSSASAGEAATVVAEPSSVEGDGGGGGGVAVESVRRQLSNLLKEAIKTSVPDQVEVEPMVEMCKNANFGDYQCNNAMGIWSKIRGKSSDFKNPNAIGQAIARNLPETPIVTSTSIAGPGFVNIVLSSKWMEDRIRLMLIDGVDTWAPKLAVKRAVVDFSSPNIAKEMHVGHLRSTIIGECISRMLEFCHVDVLRRNHVGDWGTQFGMLIEFLFEKFPNWEDVGEQAIGDLQTFYKAAKAKFDVDPEFKATAQKAVVLLQGGDPTYLAAWSKICEISRLEFARVYQRLQATIEERGESFYNPYIADVISQLTEKGLVEDSEGARVINVAGHNIPLIVVKKDGGFNYASTDMAALWYRLNVEKAEWLIYVTDVGQQQHFDMVFRAGKMAGWIPEKADEFPRVKHVGFGLVLGADGKRFRTRSTEVVRLVDLLDEAKARSKQELEARGKATEWSVEEVEAATDALGYGAVKYADLKNNRLTNYTFNFEQMLDIRGNTAVYLLYAHARICSILRNSSKDVEELKRTCSPTLTHRSERQLGLHLILFADTIEDCLVELLPNTLCEYLYTLADKFTDFYTNCKVVGSEEEDSRVLICEATAVVMRQCFKLLGLTPLYRL